MTMNATEKHGIYFHVGQNTPNMEQDTNEYDVYFHVGDKVRVDENAKGTIWETGIIADINKDDALINYGTPQNPIFGMGRRVPLTRLEVLGELN